MLYRRKNKAKGFTLVEVIISMAILGIIMVSFLTMFSGGLVNILGAGNKTKYLGEAKSVINDIYESKSLSSIPEGWKKTSSKSELYTYDSKLPRRYMVENYPLNGVYYNKVTLVIFYNRGKGNTSLTAIVPRGGI